MAIHIKKNDTVEVITGDKTNERFAGVHQRAAGVNGQEANAAGPIRATNNPAVGHPCGVAAGPLANPH